MVLQYMFYSLLVYVAWQEFLLDWLSDWFDKQNQFESFNQFHQNMDDHKNPEYLKTLQGSKRIWIQLKILFNKSIVLWLTIRYFCLYVIHAYPYGIWADKSVFSKDNLIGLPKLFCPGRVRGLDRLGWIMRGEEDINDD